MIISEGVTIFFSNKRLDNKISTKQLNAWTTFTLTHMKIPHLRRNEKIAHIFIMYLFTPIYFFGDEMFDLSFLFW